MVLAHEDQGFSLRWGWGGGPCKNPESLRPLQVRSPQEKHLASPTVTVVFPASSRSPHGEVSPATTPSPMFTNAQGANRGEGPRSPL